MPAHIVRTHRWTLTLLALLMLLGSIPRYWGLSETGPYFVDQGEYMLEARWFHETARNLSASLPKWIANPPDPLTTELRRVFREAEGHPMVMGRPLHNLLAALPMFFVEYRPYLGNVVSATFGVFSIPALFLLYRRLFGHRGALPAAALLTFMGLHVYYSRNFFPEADSTFFLLVAWILYAKSREKAAAEGTGWIVLTGLAWGMAVAASDRWLSMVIIIWALEAQLLLWEKKVSWRRTFWRLVAFHGALLLPLFAIELPYVVLRIIFWIAGENIPFQSYLQILVKHFLIAQAMAAARFIEALPVSGFRLSDLLVFPDILVRYNGPVYTALLVVGLVRTLWTRRFGDLFSLCCFFLPAIYLQIQAYHCMRHYSITFPVVAILVARGLFADNLFDRNRGNVTEAGSSPWWRFALIALFVLTLASGILASRKAMRFPFGYWQATQAISDRGWKAWTTSEWIFESYLGEKVFEPSPKTLEELLEGHAEGIRVLVVDVHPFLWELAEEIGIRHEEDLARLSVLKAVQEKAEPVAVFPNPGSATPDLTFEVLFHYDDAFKVGERIRSSGADTIRIYDLRPFYDEAETDSGAERSE